MLCLATVNDKSVCYVHAECRPYFRNDTTLAVLPRDSVVNMAPSQLTVTRKFTIDFMFVIFLHFTLSKQKDLMNLHQH